MKLRLGKFVLNLDRARVMGVLNITPDSFSDGGRFLSVDEAMQQVVAMVGAGVDIIDVGGESTRPGSAEIPLQEELDRVMPVIERISDRFEIPVSVDTSKSEVMCSAVAAGASMINDVFALRQDGAIEAAASLGIPVCLMHMQGEPREMQQSPVYQSLPGDVIDFLADRIEAAIQAGIAREQLIVDPGFGFGKNDQHNIELLDKLDQFSEFGLPLLVGLSRKRTLGKLTGQPVGKRVAAGVAAAIIAVQNGANIVRTHDVQQTVDALNVLHAVNQSG